jgi:hypothetical protein
MYTFKSEPGRTVIADLLVLDEKRLLAFVMDTVAMAYRIFIYKVNKRKLTFQWDGVGGGLCYLVPRLYEGKYVFVRRGHNVCDVGCL